MSDLGQAVADEEVVYRRVPLVNFVDGMIIYQAMMPHKTADADGLSLTRAKLGSPEAMVANARRPGGGCVCGHGWRNSRVGAVGASLATKGRARPLPYSGAELRYENRH